MNEPTYNAIVFYDGNCPFCYRIVKHIVFSIRNNCPFLFCPLNGKTFNKTIKTKQKNNSIVVFNTNSKDILIKSMAFIYILSSLGLKWKIASNVLSLFPIAFSDLIYDAFARIRRKFLKNRINKCEIIPPELRRFFSD